ncbi:MAG: hypothetical protein ACI4I9_05765 [Porcipelethomonas sp.]
MIITVEKFKEFAETSESDTVLEAKLQALEALIRKYTNNSFQVRGIRSQSAVLNNRILDPPEHLKSGDTIQISDSLLNNGIYTVKEISDGMTVSGELLDCTKNLITKVEYPPDVVMGVVDMLKWDLQNRDKVGVQSETISRHSVTYFSMDGENSRIGYPKSLTGFLVPYMKARF